MKWFIAVILAGAIATIVYLQRTHLKSTYVNGVVPYNTLPNREFVLERDCYLFTLTEDDTSWPLIGDRSRVSLLPAEVTEKNVGAQLPGVRILDVVRIGTRFKIVSVRRDESHAGVSITFEILLLTNEERPYPRVDAFWLLDHQPEAAGKAPAFLPEFAVEHMQK
jgi:hypothetical protein